ncbi:MAG: VOC family protein [Candidatus Limnocylindrales bacterium]|jgi:predicted enzyme related to lactoylglutathione lyase
MKLTVTLPAADLDRAKAWYSQILGLEPVETQPMGEVWYELGGSRFMLYQSQFAGTNKATAAGLQVDDFNATVAQLKERGAVLEDYDFGEDFRTTDGIMTLPDGQKAAWITDSEGNILGISSM